MEDESKLLVTLPKLPDSLRHYEPSLRKLEKLFSKDPLENLGKLKQELRQIEKALKTEESDASKTSLAQYIQLVRQRILELEALSRKTFGKELEEELKQIGFRLEGHYPLLKSSFYTLEVDFDRSTVTIWFGPQQEKLKVCNLSPKTVAQKLVELHNLITKREFVEETFLFNLYKACETVANKGKKKLEEPLPITSVLLEYTNSVQNNQVKKNYTRYGRVFFSYDIYRLKERKMNEHELELITATRAYTRRKKDFLWVPTNEKGSGTYVSHIRLRGVSNE
ncbi:MAG: hypothetical protein ACPLRT_06435 [Thermoproteota archaeon]